MGAHGISSFCERRVSSGHEYQQQTACQARGFRIVIARCDGDIQPNRLRDVVNAGGVGTRPTSDRPNDVLLLSELEWTAARLLTSRPNRVARGPFTCKNAEISKTPGTKMSTST